MHVEDRWTRPTGKLDGRGRPERERTDRYGVGLRYVAQWTESGKRRSRSFTTKDGAAAHLAAVAKAQRDGVHVASHRMTVGEYGDDWVKLQLHQRDSSRDQMESRWRLHIRPALGDLMLREVTRQHVKAAVGRWSRDLAPSTVGVVYGYLSALMKSAADDRLLGVSPCVRISLPAVEAERVVPLTVDQVMTIADKISPRYRGLVLLGAASGMRSGEIRGLTVDRLRWEVDREQLGCVTVRIDRQLVSTAPKWGPPKTSRSDRTLTIDATSGAYLAEHMANYPPHSSGLIFTGREGGPLARTSIATAWETATRGMDLPDRSGLHALRHFHASLLIAASLSVTAVADRLGHQDPTMTLRVYSHLWPTDEGRSRDAIAAGLWG